MDTDQSQATILNAFVWVVILLAVILGGVYFYNNYQAVAPNVTIEDDTGIPNAGSMATTTISVRSTAFANGGLIPAAHTCDASNSSPELSWTGAPVGTQSFVLIVDDPDVPKQLRPDGVFDHWVLFNIPATTTSIAASSTIGVVGANGAGKNAYTGPCPPKEYEPSEHRYFFRVYALDMMLDLKSGATKKEVQQAMQGHILGEGELMGRYRRQ